jgi:hypothetical protein
MAVAVVGEMSCSGGESEEVEPDGVALALFGEGPLLREEALRGSVGASVASALARISSRC